MKVAELIELLRDMEPEADVVLLRDLNPDGDEIIRDEDGNETEQETELIEIELDNVVLASSYIGFQI